LTVAENGSTVYAYRLLLKNKLGAYVEDTVNCDASQSAIIQSRICLISMTKFTTDLNLLLNDDIIATVEARNQIGYSLPSDPNATGGVTAETIP
jgi:hypothetical protein